MYETVTNSPTTTKSLFFRSSNDHVPSLPLKRQLTKDSLGPYQSYDSDGDTSIEDWPLSYSDDLHLSSTAIHRPTFDSHRLLKNFVMPARTENGTSERALGGAQRWRLNTNGQLVDTEAASAGWELADEIVRLKIGDSTGDEEIHGPIRTPPKSKLAAAAVAQLNETSPLETSSNTSVGSSPHTSDHQINISHSRGSSTDTTISSSHESVASNTLINHTFKNEANNEAKERPHSFSGGLSSADLRRLQQAGDGPSDPVDRQHWSHSQYRDNGHAGAEQLSYPSLANHIHRPQPQPHPQLYDYRSSSQAQSLANEREEQQAEYNTQQRGFGHVTGSHNLAIPAPHTFGPGRHNNVVANMNYRQPPRGFPQQNVLPNANALGYHASHLSLGNTQQLYDMMLPGPPHDHPAVTRVQQQHNIFRAAHQHSASDPSAIRDAATLALLGNNLQSYAPGMFPAALAPPPAMPIYANQYYGAPEVAAAQVMAARLQSQYTGPYGLPPQNGQLDTASSQSSINESGPASGNRKLGLYKTELCRSWEEKGSCRYGAKCQFAHGEEELRKVARHPKYKTEICRTFWVSGSCPYGKRCCFIHTELPTSGSSPGNAPGNDVSSQPRSDGRARSLSTNSDPNDATVSLLARISAKRTDSNGNSASTPIDMNPNGGFQFTRPPTGSLRVDTSALDGPSIKQNKSAYPSFASNGILLPAPEHLGAKSPAPVTAGPDLGRHNTSRIEIVGYNNQQQQQNMKKNNSNANVRHSFNGTEADVNFTLSPAAPAGHSYAMSSEASHAPRVNGHVRAGSAGNWGNFPRNSHIGTSYGHAPSPAGEIIANTPWSTNELAVGSSRLNEKAWA